MVTFVSLSFQVEVMSGSHSKVQHTRTTVVWPWRTLVKGMMPCTAELISLLVVFLQMLGMDLPKETGSFQMELELLMNSGSSTEKEVI